MSILIQNVLLNDERKDIIIKDNKFSKILDPTDSIGSSDLLIDGTRFAILPAFYNMHTHSAMTLMRGYADDIELHSWLEDHIWPLEANLTEDHVYHGARLAALEMIKSGTVFFNDMYFFPYGTAKAADEMGLRADIAPVLIDGMNAARAKEMIAYAQETIDHSGDYSSRVRFAVSPHAIYTVSAETLKRSFALAQKENLPFQIHLSESQTEVKNSIKDFGLRPVQYLESLGILDSNVTAIHCVHLDDRDREILKKHNVSIAHCPASNMKLSSGHFDYVKAKQADIKMVVATDGACSNNNLSLLEEMKIASLREKAFSGDPTVLPAREIFDMTTIKAAKAAGLNAGKIEEGMLADCLLVNLDHPTLVPRGHLISDIVYSANPECIDTVICDGNILMRGRKVKNEDDIIKGANEAYRDLIRK
ncbi:MAG: amidohydrolase [Candidatus Marinimicrobia bacterium]|nr:amidohydrolase [Candidatus Neomarinimicrobiota bacterium]